MARRKGTPERSKLTRKVDIAFARKRVGDGQDIDGKKTDEPADEAAPNDTASQETKPEKAVALDVTSHGDKPEAKADKPEAKADKPEAKADKPEAKADKPEAKADKPEAKADKPEAKTAEGTQPPPLGAKPDELPLIEPPPPKAEPWPDATPPPMRPVEPPRTARLSSPTVAMDPHSDLGKPPEMPRTTPPPPLALGAVEDPTHMPGPKDVPSGSPDDPAPPPGHVPPGDSRSLRRGRDFALIYRVGTCVITRVGVIGTRGQWRVVEYPTYAFASGSYAKECSRFVSEGFSDYRE